MTVHNLTFFTEFVITDHNGSFGGFTVSRVVIPIVVIAVVVAAFLVLVILFIIINIVTIISTTILGLLEAADTSV